MENSRTLSPQQVAEMLGVPVAMLSPQQVAEMLGVPLATVYRWNHTGVGPRLHKIGRHVRYDRADVEEWIAARRRNEVQ